METMDPAELEAAMAATGAIIEELTSTGPSSSRVG